MDRTKDPEQTARWFRASGDEARLKILERLSEGEQCVCDLTDALDAGQSLMSFHLRMLQAGTPIKVVTAARAATNR